MVRNDDRHVLMVGTSLDSPGGMTAVVQAYRAAGLFERWSVLYVATFAAPGVLKQVRIFGQAWVRCLAILATRRASLVHVHSASRGSFWRKSLVACTAWMLRVPYLFHLHSGEFERFYYDECSPFGKAWARLVLRSAAAVVALSPQMKALLERIEPAARVVLLPNPVHLPTVLVELRERASSLLFLGRLREKKGVFDLLRALAQVMPKHPTLSAVLAGDGDLDGVRRLAVELGISDRVATPGWIESAAKENALRRADILVLPSYYEGVPICILEAMAAGVPVISTSVGGAPYLLDDGRCGILVPTGDTRVLATAIDRLICDTDLRRDFAQSARQRAEQHFSDSVVITALEALWCAIQNARVTTREVR